MVPLRFQAECHFCKDPIDLRKAGVYQWTCGWVKNRKEGGGNAIALPHREPMWACSLCVDKESRGQAQYQMGLFS